ncbi:vinculin family domain-containing protein [Ditylenchus destructor]|uniref:Vinculin family domain-containing protein n=1 Tax=Ditylenchus destructor TaxID=166010 RepID=A0AAD4QXE3_9BILA|nr:vinculin family domain-containing protein [Ditylenchus destructor]
MAAGQMSLTSFDPRNLEIKTKSVEQTLLPLVPQISTLVNFKENIIAGSRTKSECALRAALKIGSTVKAAVERFVVVGETIADENPDIQPEMYDACQEARSAVLTYYNWEIRISLHLVGICVSDGILPFDPTCYCVQPESGQLLEGPIDIGIQLTANVCIKQLTEMLDMVKMMALIGTGVQDRLVSALDS